MKCIENDKHICIGPIDTASLSPSLASWSNLGDNDLSFHLPVHLLDLHVLHHPRQTQTLRKARIEPLKQSCKNVPTVPTSWCYFSWPVLIFGKSTRKTGEKQAKNRQKTGEKQAKTRENRRKHAKTRENRRKTGAFLVLIFWGGKLVGANFYAFCNYVYHLQCWTEM